VSGAHPLFVLLTYNLLCPYDQEEGCHQVLLF
jgi:hypothetical protein